MLASYVMILMGQVQHHHLLLSLARFCAALLSLAPQPKGSCLTFSTFESYILPTKSTAAAIGLL